MNDIDLVRTDNGTYDWHFDGVDVVEVGGTRRLRSAVIHDILLREDELSQSVYADKGCALYSLVKAKNSESINNYIRECIIGACTTISGVANASCTIIREDNKIRITDIRLMLEDGREVDIGAI